MQRVISRAMTNVLRGSPLVDDPGAGWRCRSCRKLIAEHIRPPYRIVCGRCGEVHDTRPRPPVYLTSGVGAT